MRQGRQISAAGVNRELAALRFICNYARRLELVVRNPVSGVRFLPEGPGCMRIVSHEEEQRYLAVAHSTLRDVATMMLETGMCPAEIFNLTRDSVHRDEHYVVVTKGKTAFRRRNVPLTRQSLAVVRQRLASCKGEYLFAHRLDPNKSLTDVHHKHLDAIRDANIRPRFRLYDLRHTFGSRMAMAGVDLATLKEMMGHAKITTTMRYVHPTPEHKRRAVEKLERFNNEQVFALYEAKEGVGTKVGTIAQTTSSVRPVC